MCFVWSCGFSGRSTTGGGRRKIEYLLSVWERVTVLTEVTEDTEREGDVAEEEELSDNALTLFDMTCAGSVVV